MSQTQSLERLLTRTEVNGSCLLWVGAINKVTKYGYTSISGKISSVHRAAWILYHKQEIPIGLVIHHTCNNKTCINPEHLRCITQKENLSQKDGLIMGNILRQKNKTHCPYGHTYTEVLEMKRGSLRTHRICRECRNSHSRERLAKKKQVI